MKVNEKIEKDKVVTNVIKAFYVYMVFIVVMGFTILLFPWNSNLEVMLSIIVGIIGCVTLLALIQNATSANIEAVNHEQILNH